jgi:Fe-S cluster assembly protein SufD
MTEKPIIIKKIGSPGSKTPGDISIDPKFSDENISVRDYRMRSWERYTATPLPTERDEDWRRTSLKEINFPSYDLRVPEDVPSIPEFLIEPMADKQHSGQVLVTPQGAKRQIADTLKEKGVVFIDLVTAAKENKEILEKVFKKLDLIPANKFALLAGALPFNGVLLYVPRGVEIDSPLQSVYWAAGNGYLHASHVFIYLEEESSAVFVHESASPIDDRSLHAGLFNIFVGKNASLSFVELQSWGQYIYNFTQEDVEVEEGGNIDWIFGALGSRLTKNYSNLNLRGTGSTGKMSGFYFTDKQQHLDHDTQQNHLAASTTSDLLFKGALLDESHSVWQGMIYVAPNASKSDGYQANRNLVLSKKARADSIPGLEILTDDVRCTHGATVGKIDEDQIFYLESRGLQRSSAEQLIVEGFFDPIMQRIPFEGVKKRFQQAIKQKMGIQDI